MEPEYPLRTTLVIERKMIGDEGLLSGSCDIECGYIAPKKNLNIESIPNVYMLKRQHHVISKKHSVPLQNLGRL